MQKEFLPLKFKIYNYIKKIHDELYFLIIIHKKIKIKVIYRFYTLLFLNIIIFKSQKYQWSPKHVKYKNYYLKTSFNFNFLKKKNYIVLKTKTKILPPIRPLRVLFLRWALTKFSINSIHLYSSLSLREKKQVKI